MGLLRGAEQDHDVGHPVGEAEVAAGIRFPYRCLHATQTYLAAGGVHQGLGDVPGLVHHAEPLGERKIGRFGYLPAVHVRQLLDAILAGFQLGQHLVDLRPREADPRVVRYGENAAER